MLGPPDGRWLRAIPLSWPGWPPVRSPSRGGRAMPRERGQLGRLRTASVIPARTFVVDQLLATESVLHVGISSSPIHHAT